MKIPMIWNVGCPYCKVETAYHTISIEIHRKLTIKCEMCGTEIDITPDDDTWLDWLTERNCDV